MPPGIVNGGAAVCYFNAAMQALASAEPLVDFLRRAAPPRPSAAAAAASSASSSPSSSASSASSDLLREASALLSALSAKHREGSGSSSGGGGGGGGRRAPPRPLSSARLLSALRAASPTARSSLGANRQQDAAEAAQLFLDAVSVAAVSVAADSAAAVAAAPAAGRKERGGGGAAAPAPGPAAAPAGGGADRRGLAAFSSPSSLPPLSRWVRAPSSAPAAPAPGISPCAGTVLAESGCARCGTPRPSEVTAFAVLPLPLPPLPRPRPRRGGDGGGAPPPFVSSLRAALSSLTGAEALTSPGGGLECGRCSLRRVLWAAREDAAEAEARGLPPPAWRRLNMGTDEGEGEGEGGGGSGGGGGAARREFSELLQLAFPAGAGAGRRGWGAPPPFPLDVAAVAERARRAGLPWDRTVSGPRGGGAGGDAAAAAAAPSELLLRETAVRRATLARCPSVLCLQLLRATGPEEKLRGGVDFGLVVDMCDFTAAGAEPLLPSWRGKGGGEGEAAEGEAWRRPRAPVSDAEAEAAGAAPLRQFIEPLSPPPRPRQLPPERHRGPIYLLFAVVAHTGSGTSRGHYICYRRLRRPPPWSAPPSASPASSSTRDDGKTSAFVPPPSASSWCGCSDLRVWRASDEEVRRCEAVMLVYCRQ